MCSCIGINCNFSIPCDQLVLCCFPHEGAPRRRSINGLRDDWRRLKAERDHTERMIRESSPQMLPTEQVNEWLRQVAALEGKIEKLTTKYNVLHPRTDNTPESANNSLVRHESQEANIFCYCSPIINPIKSCLLWRKIQFTDQKVLDLLKHKPPDIIENPLLPPAQQMPTDPTTGMQSMLDEIWSHVENQQDDHVRLIGLHGMGGVGKTTLLIAVNNKLCSSTRNFDQQLFIVVSKTPNLVDIQNQIGAKIGFHDENWKTKSQREKATDIYNALFKKKYILLLDDLWEPFNLKEIGIPHPELQNMKEATNKSMVIFTTRSLDVCRQMKATEIQVRCLNEVEAWNLFKESVGERTLKAHHDIPDRARVLMRECNGLPLALVVIGQAMSSKTTIHEWENAIQVLKRYTSDLSSTVTDKVFITLKYSYDNLTNAAIRSCLLYCSLYAEDEEILKSDLVDKWICEGYLSTFDDLRDARNEGYSYISTLVRASLLEKCSLDENVKMHDVIRDMTLWIAGDGFYVKARAGLTQIPEDVKWENVEKLSLMYNSIEEFNNGPTKFTNLETMLFCSVGFISFNNVFWKFFTKLKVLDLSSNRSLQSLPKEVGDLVCLQYLNLSYTPLKELPNELQKLVKLKYLNVESTKIDTIPEGVLSSMKELLVFICGEKLTSVLNLVKECEGLKYLQDVRTVKVTSKVEISKVKSSINLLNCITRFAMIDMTDSTSLDILFLKEMKHLQTLVIKDLTKVERIVVGNGQGLETSTTNNRNGFNNLRSLHVVACPRLTNLSWLVLLPNIEHLIVLICGEMQRLVSENEYKVDNEVEPFAKLQRLQLRGLNKLESIYFTSLPFPCLKKLEVHDCYNLKKLPFNSSSCDQGRGITIKGRNEWWNELQWEDEATRTTFSSRFQ